MPVTGSEYATVARASKKLALGANLHHNHASGWERTRSTEVTAAQAQFPLSLEGTRQSLNTPEGHNHKRSEHLDRQPTDPLAALVLFSLPCGARAAGSAQ
jgi:hypothetical protein